MRFKFKNSNEGLTKEESGRVAGTLHDCEFVSLYSLRYTVTHNNVQEFSIQEFRKFIHRIYG